MSVKNDLLALWVDLEVTSFCPVHGALTQLSCIIEKDGQAIDRINLHINPFTYSKPVEVLDYNLKRSNKTREEIKNNPDASNQFRLFKNFINKHLKGNQFLQLAGHNVAKHDSKFIEYFFKDYGEDMYKYFSYAHLDTLHLARHMRHWGMLDRCKDDKLGTLCEHFGVTLDNWHNSMEDIEATLKMYEKMKQKILKEMK